jgi:hypothetical protein
MPKATARSSTRNADAEVLELFKRYTAISDEFAVVPEEDDPRREVLLGEIDRLALAITTAQISTARAQRAKALVVKLEGVHSDWLLHLILKADEDRIAARRAKTKRSAEHVGAP